MHRSILAMFPLVPAILLASCGKKELALPADPVDQAATCGVVEAANARATSKTVQGPLPFDQQGRIMHYALLAGGDGKDFAQDKVAAVVNRMPELEAGITGGKWQALVTPCHAAYPQTDPAKAVKLPADAGEARLLCYALGDFLTRAMQRQDAAYGDQLTSYRELNRGLDTKVGTMLKARGQSSPEATMAAKGEALAKAAQLGSPMVVMKGCLGRFG